MFTCSTVECKTRRDRAASFEYPACQGILTVSTQRSATPARLLLAAAAIAAIGTIIPGIAAAQSTPNTPAPDALSDIPQLRDQLYGNASRPDQRESAAARLLARQSPEARALVISSLSWWGNPAIQRAGAKALGDAPIADNQVIDPLFALLLNPPERVEKATIDAAARALTAFKSDPNVRARLIEQARRGNDFNVRLASIGALATFTDKTAAQTLIEFLDPALQPQINSAAASGLAYMTGLDANTTAWPKWWEANRDKPDQQFLAELTTARAARYDRTSAALDNVKNELARMLSDQYQRAARPQRPDLLLSYLRSPAPSFRAVATRIAADAAQTDVTAPAVREQLRQLIGDADPEVRRGAASAIALINDPEALTPLLTQLGQESDTTVRAAIANALRPLRDVRAVKPLLILLKDDSAETAQAAAQALSERELGRKLRETDPLLADAAAEELRNVLSGRTTPINSPDLRSDLITAIGAMQSRKMDNTKFLLQRLNDPQESVKVKRSLLQAIGELKDDRFAELIAQFIDEKEDPSVRLAAIRALEASGANAIPFEQRLSRFADPKGPDESRPEIQQAAWKTLSASFPKATEDQLNYISSRLRGKDQVDKRIKALEELKNKARGRDDQDYVARYNQSIGETYQLGEKYNEAIPFYKDAFDYATESRKVPMQETVAEGMMECMLRGRQYPTAIEFLQKLARSDPKWQGLLGPKIKTDVERLVKENQYDSALQLIEAALAAKNPALAATVLDTLASLKQEIERRVKEHNAKPDPLMERPLNAMAR